MITFNKLGKYGRFGNQLFHIASTIGIAKKHGYGFSFPYWKERGYFKNILPRTNNQYLDSLRELKLSSNRGLMINYMDFDCPDNVSLLGHFFSEKYFAHCKEIIRHAFEMKPIEGLPEIEENSICIHVRAGDFGTKQFPRLTKEYYARAFYSVAEKDKISNIYVFSDDIRAARKMFNAPFMFIFDFIETGDYIKDFYLMRQCKHFIIANSTYSWWAAWLGKHPDKIVVAPKNMETAIYTDEMYPKKWIVL